MSHLSQYLSQNIIQLRQTKNLSQEKLAKLAGIPRSTVTYIESGQSNPSLHSLVKIAGALQVSIEELLNQPRADCKIIRSTEVPVQRKAQGMAKLYKLLPDSIPGMEIDRMVLEPKGRLGGIPHTQNTKEYLICIQGEVQVQVAGEKYDLKSGDILAFPGSQNHSYQNLSADRAADCFSVVTIAPHGV